LETLFLVCNGEILSKKDCFNPCVPVIETEDAVVIIEYDYMQDIIVKYLIPDIDHNQRAVL
jgi:hypothetical protein